MNKSGVLFFVNATRVAVLTAALAAMAACVSMAAKSAPSVEDGAGVTITLEPSNTVAVKGKDAHLSVAAAAADGGALTYQWFKTREPVNRNSDDIQVIGNKGEFIPPLSEGGTAIKGAVKKTFNAPARTGGVNSYYVEVSNGTSTVRSKAATVAVKSSETRKPSSPVKILFICGGNTGRSPMAKAIAEKVFAERGIPAVFTSAGSDIIDGDKAEPNAVTLMAERGLDLSGHVAQWWTPEMLENADYVFVMSGSHKNRVNVATLGIYEEKVALLREFVGDSGSVPDPWGEPMAKYVETADVITDAVGKLADIMAARSN